MRRGLLGDLDDVFSSAEEMCGSGDPDTIEARQSAIRALREEVTAIMVSKQCKLCEAVQALYRRGS